MDREMKDSPTILAIIEVMWDRPSIPDEDISEIEVEARAIISTFIRALETDLRVHVWSSFGVKRVDKGSQAANL